jgi:UDP-glucose 4-epimerase
MWWVEVKESYNKTFNIGADQEFTVNKLAETTCEVLGIKGDVRHVEARNEVMHAYADHSLVQKTFNITSHTSLKDGLAKMAEWAKTAGIRASQKFKGIEITEKLPPIWLED